jgi:hypothetical protein
VSDDLTAWLRQQIGERKATAVAALHGSDGHWWRRPHDETGEPVGPLWDGEPSIDSDGEVLGGREQVVYDEGRPSDAQFEHIAANDPRDTIARCEAELAILDEHYILWVHDTNEAYEEFSVVSIGGANKDHGCVTCHYYSQGGVKGYGYCRTVRLLASAYRHCDGYREEWKP